MNLPDAIDKIRPSVVQIRFSASDLSEKLQAKIGRDFISFSIGTGFIISNECHIITADHVINTSLNEITAKRKMIGIGFPELNSENIRGNFQIVDFDIIDEDTIHDLALLKPRRNPFKGEIPSMIKGSGREESIVVGVANLNPKRPRDGEAIGISGYPLDENILVTTAGSMATSLGIEIKEVKVPGAPDWWSMPEMSDIYLADVEANPGNSGGPVFLVEDGSVIGVCVSTKITPIIEKGGPSKELFYKTRLTQIVPTKYINKLLDHSRTSLKHIDCR